MKREIILDPGNAVLRPVIIKTMTVERIEIGMNASAFPQGRKVKITMPRIDTRRDLNAAH